MLYAYYRNVHVPGESPAPVRPGAARLGASLSTRPARPGQPGSVDKNCRALPFPASFLALQVKALAFIIRTGVI